LSCRVRVRIEEEEGFPAALGITAGGLAWPMASGPATTVGWCVPNDGWTGNVISHLNEIKLTSPNAGPSGVEENSTIAFRSFHFPQLAALAEFPAAASRTRIFATSFT
jgi:hypothetical protein